MSAIKNISLYIPHIFANYTKSDVSNVFENLNIGKVKNIDFISKMDQDGKTFNAAYIHFEYWFDNIVASNFQERVLTKSPAKLMYDDPWFWLVLENKGRKFATGERKQCIDLGDLKQCPEKINTPEAPIKNTQCQMDEIQIMDAMDAMIEECEAQQEEDNLYLINIDGRYVQELETENAELRMQLMNLQNAYYIESVNHYQALQLIHKKSN